MIPNDKKHRERMKQSGFIPKPGQRPMWFNSDESNPELMGAHQMQKNKNKRKKK